MTAIATSPLLDAVIAPESVVRARLANGLRVLLRRDTSAPVVAIVTYVKAGYFDETDDVVGIAHVLEHMYFKGTPTRGVGDIARETKASGGYLNAATIYDHTHYYAVLPSSGFAAGLAIQADAFANSLIDAAELSRELEVIVEEAKRKTDSPAALSTETLYALLHDAHRIRRWRIGREAGLRTLTRDQVDQFYRNFYRPSNTVLAIVGDIEPERALGLVKRHYGGIPDSRVERSGGPAEPARADVAPRYLEITGDIQQAELLVGWRTPAITHDDTPALDLLAAALANGRASRLYRAVRERRLASSVAAYNYTPEELGVFVVHAAARPERARGAVRAVWDEMRRARDGAITEVEVERARRVMEAQLLRRMGTMQGQASHLAGWELMGDWRLGGAYVERLLDAGADRVAEVAERWLSPESAGLVVYRPSGTPPLASSTEELRATLESESTQPLAPIIRPRRPSPLPGSRAWSLEREEAGVCVFRTSAGIPLLVQRRPGAIAHLGWFVRGGAVDEDPAQAGITSLMARTALKGTERRTSQRIAEDAEFLGGVISSSVGADGFDWTISVPVHRLDDAAELLGDVLQRPSFAESALEAERSVALANLASLRDDMYRWPIRLATEAAWEGHPYGQSVLGTEASLAAMTVQALQGCHETRALEAPGVLICVGDVEPGVAAGLAARYFGALRSVARAPGAPPVWPAHMVQREDSRDKAQSALAMLFPGVGRHDETRFAAAMIGSVTSGLGGRFFDELRDRQSLAYTVTASPVIRQHAGAFCAYIAMSPEKEEQARNGLLDQFARLREQPVTERELIQAQKYALGSMAIRRESAGNVIADIADAWLFGGSLSELAEYEDRVRAVTAQQMLEFGRRWFLPECRAEGIVRGAGREV